MPITDWITVRRHVFMMTVTSASMGPYEMAKSTPDQIIYLPNISVTCTVVAANVKLCLNIIFFWCKSVQNQPKYLPDNHQDQVQHHLQFLKNQTKSPLSLKMQLSLKDLTNTNTPTQKPSFQEPNSTTQYDSKWHYSKYIPKLKKLFQPPDFMEKSVHQSWTVCTSRCHLSCLCQWKAFLMVFFLKMF